MSDREALVARLRRLANIPSFAEATRIALLQAADMIASDGQHSLADPPTPSDIEAMHRLAGEQHVVLVYDYADEGEDSTVILAYGPFASEADAKAHERIHWGHVMKLTAPG